MKSPEGRAPKPSRNRSSLPISPVLEAGAALGCAQFGMGTPKPTALRHPPPPPPCFPTLGKMGSVVGKQLHLACGLGKLGCPHCKTLRGQHKPDGDLAEAHPIHGHTGLHLDLSMLLLSPFGTHWLSSVTPSQHMGTSRGVGGSQAPGLCGPIALDEQLHPFPCALQRIRFITTPLKWWPDPAAPALAFPSFQSHFGCIKPNKAQQLERNPILPPPPPFSRRSNGISSKENFLWPNELNLSLASARPWALLGAETPPSSSPPSHPWLYHPLSCARTRSLWRQRGCEHQHQVLEHPGCSSCILPSARRMLKDARGGFAHLLSWQPHG